MDAWEVPCSSLLKAEHATVLGRTLDFAYFFEPTLKQNSSEGHGERFDLAQSPPLG
jgi:hypothetical protein